ncbi:MAG TPA: hypothetical protein VL991_08405 [Terracidiphilus sp.]|nr:hypothetical protein [Terracidiphilus sp.]
MTISRQPGKTDWDRIHREVEMDSPIPYDANDPDEGPYDPNDDEAVERFHTEANRVPPQKAGDTRKVAKTA